ncbi:hypothetical protein GQ44DRAFT_710230 [Phaeosphaeriaceae sp. PMI808]|nr:hypothetical protein GQ44DRAFT_710230 [Phaeosphaeriaceae sp. PMI808]
MLDEDGLSDCIDKHFQLDFHFLHFDAIATSMVCSLLLVDIRWSWEKAKGIHDQVTSVELKMTEAGSDKSNDLITILNVCGQQIKQWDLECRRYFHRKAIVWLDKLLEEKPRKVSAYQLLEFDRYDQLGDPHTLQERIASVRALIDEDIVKNQQEQNVYLQRRIVEQQEKMQMIQEPSLRLTERLAEEADRDRLATRAREEANAKLTELSASIARQSLELARETRRDSRTMRGIGWVTMGFLPATFVASCFGMNFFNVTKEKPYFDESVKSVWIFFVFALPISAMVLWQFYRWDAKSERDALAREESQKEGNLVVRDSP